MVKKTESNFMEKKIKNSEVFSSKDIVAYFLEKIYNSIEHLNSTIDRIHKDAEFDNETSEIIWRSAKDDPPSFDGNDYGFYFVKVRRLDRFGKPFHDLTATPRTACCNSAGQWQSIENYNFYGTVSMPFEVVCWAPIPDSLLKNPTIIKDISEVLDHER